MQYAYVPKTWNSYKHDGTALPGFGYATYRLKVLADDADSPLSLRLDTMSTAYRLYIDDREIASGGRVGTNQSTSAPGYELKTLDFLPPGKEFDIIVQVSNFTYARGGIWYDMNIGTHEQIDVLNRVIIYKDAALIGSMIIMALYYLGFFFTYATLYWIPTAVFLMVDSIYADRFPFYVKRAVILYCIITTVLTAFLPIRVYTACIWAIEAVGIGITAFSIGIVTKAWRQREKGAGLIALSISTILLAGVHDVLYQANVIHHALGELASIGIFLFTLTLSFIIAGRLSDAYEKEKNLTLQLAESLEKEKAAAEELVRTELSFLKAQIKPHFLYNTLNVITALTTRDPPRAKALLYDLSDYLRGSFNFENYNGVMPVESELATVRAYLAIEKERFQGKLSVAYDIDESVDILVPMLAIQPLVENAIRHGILKKTEGGTVMIGV